jgi:hypothetical protein
MSKVALAYLVIAAASAAAPSSNTVRIDTWTTVATPARPEVHVLLRNGETTPLAFVLEIGDLQRGSKVECAGSYTGEPDLLTRFHFWNGVSFGDSSGVIPANGWTHRSFVLGEYGYEPPCSVPYRLRTTSPASIVEGVIEVPKGASPVRETVSREDIRWDLMVEEHRIYDHRLVARLLVENRSARAIVLGLDRRSLDCDGAGRASWSSHHGVIQGQDVGPIQIPGRGWGVFVAAIDYWGTENPADCRMSADLQLDTSRGRTTLARVEFRLEPTGFLGAARR